GPAPRPLALRCFFFSRRRRHTRFDCDWSSDVCSSDLTAKADAIASLIDTASAFAVLTQIETDERVTTTDLTIHYLRPLTAGRMTAAARVVRGGRRLFVLSVEVTNETSVLVATAVTTYIKVG